jgi:hypothetical protein
MINIHEVVKIPMETLVNSVLDMLSNTKITGFRRIMNQGIVVSNINIMLTKGK